MERWALLEFPFTFVSSKEYNILKEELEENELKWYKIADTEIIDKLTTPNELSGLLNWSLLGLERILKQGDFSGSKSVNDVKTEWIRKSDSFNAFLMDFIDQDYDSMIIKNDLRKAYGLYCQKHKIRAKGDKHILFTLSSIGVGEGRERGLDTEKRTYWDGIKFKSFDDNGKSVKGDKEDRGISTLRDNLIIAIGVKTIVSRDIHDTIEPKKQRKLNFQVEKEDIKDETISEPTHQDDIPPKTEENIENTEKQPKTPKIEQLNWLDTWFPKDDPDSEVELTEMYEKGVTEAQIKEKKKSGEIWEPKPGFVRRL